MMVRVSYVIGLLPCAIALSNDASPAAKRVAIIGEQHVQHLSLGPKLTFHRSRCWWLFGSLPSRPIRRLLVHAYQHHRLRAQLLHRRAHHHCRCLVRSHHRNRARRLHIRLRKSDPCQCYSRLEPLSSLTGRQSCDTAGATGPRNMGRHAIRADHKGRRWLVG